VRWVLAGLLLWPVLELIGAIEVGRSIGALATIGLLALIAVVGALVVRREGAAAWRSLNASVRTGEPPSRELAGATVLMLAGILLIIPGFISDVVALALIVAHRPLGRWFLGRSLRRAEINEAIIRTRFGAGPSPSPYRRGDVVEGEIVDE
jgi:UPF0716 protein FxsA